MYAALQCLISILQVFGIGCYPQAEELQLLANSALRTILFRYMFFFFFYSPLVSLICGAYCQMYTIM